MGELKVCSLSCKLLFQQWHLSKFSSSKQVMVLLGEPKSWFIFCRAQLVCEPYIWHPWCKTTNVLLGSFKHFHTTVVHLNNPEIIRTIVFLIFWCSWNSPFQINILLRAIVNMLIVTEECPTINIFLLWSHPDSYSTQFFS